LRFAPRSPGARRALHAFPTRRSSDLGVGDGETGLDDVRERSVAGDFPPDVVWNGIHAAAIDRGGGEAGPEDDAELEGIGAEGGGDRKSTRLNSSHVKISYAVFCVKKK